MSLIKKENYQKYGGKISLVLFALMIFERLVQIPLASQYGVFVNLWFLSIALSLYLKHKFNPNHELSATDERLIAFKNQAGNNANNIIMFVLFIVAHVVFYITKNTDYFMIFMLVIAVDMMLKEGLYKTYNNDLN